MVNDMKIRVAMALAVILAAIVASGCGSDGVGVGDQGSPADLAAGTSRIIFSGGGILEQSGGTSGGVTTRKGTVGLKSVYDDASTVCLFETPTSTSSGIQIVTSTAPSDSSCTDKNKCILCTLGAATPVADCSISCIGTVPSTSATAADSVHIFVTVSSRLHTNAPSATGMVRYDAYSDNWPEFSMSNFPVSTDFTGCDGTAASHEVGLNTGSLVYDYPYWTSTHQTHGYAINALNPDSTTTPANQSTCTTSFKYYAAMPLTGADVSGTTIDFSGKSLTFRATMCDTADSTNSDPNAGSATCQPRTAPLLLAHFDEGAGVTTFADSSGNSVSLTCTSCPTAGEPGKYGYAALFDGTSNALTVGGTWGGWSEVTISAWIKNTGTTGNFEAVVSSTSLNFIHMQLYSAGNNIVYATPNNVTLPILSPTPLNTWRHVAVTVNANTNTVVLYENGVALSTITTTAFDTVTTATKLLIGAGYSGGRYFKGLIDDVAIYNVALSAAEIASIYNSTSPIP